MASWPGDLNERVPESDELNKKKKGERRRGEAVSVSERAEC